MTPDEAAAHAAAAKVERLIEEAMEKFSGEELAQLHDYVCSALAADMAIQDAAITAQAFEHVMDRWRKAR